MRLYLVLILGAVLYHNLASANDDDAPMTSDVDTNDAEIRLFYGGVAKRACVSRGGNCDHSPSDCCPSTACRCNLWGANCRCQRKGVFQNWG